MRAGTDAIEAEGAIKIPRLARQMQFQFATTLMFVSAQTIVRFTSGANVGLANFDFKR
jgi:hypothetical protein